MMYTARTRVPMFRAAVWLASVVIVGAVGCVQTGGPASAPARAQGDVREEIVSADSDTIAGGRKDDGRLDEVGGSSPAPRPAEDSWKGLARTTFRDEAERERTHRLLDMLDNHMKAHPERPPATPLFFMLKGDPASVAEANRRIAAGETEHSAHGGEAMPLLYEFADLLTDEARAALVKRKTDNLREGQWHWTRSTGLYNVNWALSACNFLIVDGERMGNPAAAEHGYKKLQAILDRMTSLPIGTVSEFNSPTYSGIHTGPLASLVRYCANEEYRIKARILEERVWLDLATRHSPAIRQLAGPYSRVYHDGLAGATGITRSQMFKVFDESIHTQFDVSLHYPHYWDLAFVPLIAFQPYHCPDYIRAVALGKTFPYEVRGTSAGDPSRDRYPFALTDLHTYMTDHWSLSSNSRHWLHGNQNAACVAYWRKRPEVNSMKDFKVLISRYQINDSGPDVASLSQPELGRINTLQDKGTIIVAYKPKKEVKDIRSLRLDIQIPLYEDVDELSVGHRPVSPQAPNVATGLRRGNGDRPGSDTRVYLRDGDVFVGILPLEPTNIGVARPLRIQRHNEFLLVSIYNLDSPVPQQFEDETLDHCRNGFILELADVSQYPTLDAFREHFDTGQVKDEMEGDVRTISYTNGTQNMTMKHNMVTEEFVERSVNGQPVRYPLFSCPHARISLEGEIAVGRGRLTTEPGTYAWLIADDDSLTYAAYNFSENMTPLVLETPSGTVRAAKFGFGKVVFRPRGTPTLEVWAVRREGPITFPAVPGARVTLNGEDITVRAARQTVAGREVLLLP